VKTSLRIFLLLNHAKNFSLERDSQALNKSQQEAFSSTFRAKAKFFKPRVSYDSCNVFFLGIEVTQNSISPASNNKQS